MAVEELLAELERIWQANSDEGRHYNSDAALESIPAINRIAALHSINADSRWIRNAIAAIREAQSFVIANRKEPT